jgi:hypothetical protein
MNKVYMVYNGGGQVAVVCDSPETAHKFIKSEAGKEAFARHYIEVTVMTADRIEEPVQVKAGPASSKPKARSRK